MAIPRFKPINEYCFIYWVGQSITVLFLENTSSLPNKILATSKPNLKDEAWWVFEFKLPHIVDTFHSLWKHDTFPLPSLLTEEQNEDTVYNL